MGSHMSNMTDSKTGLRNDGTGGSSDAVAVLGTGSFGQALAKRLGNGGVKVVLGSRHPGKIESGQTSLNHDYLINMRNIIILAVPFKFVSSLPLDKLSPHQIIVDCSNRGEKCKPGEMSQAENIQDLLPPGCVVVKCFNTLSAHELDSRGSGGRELPLASDSREAKAVVSKLVERIGYRACDFGTLAISREIENIPLSLFPEWQKPLAISSLLWVFLYALEFGRYYLCPDKEWGWYPYHPHHLTNLFHYDLMKTFSGHALTMLASCYLPGVLAGYLQLLRGTKYSKFPGWLDSWLQMRKQLGLLVLVSVNIHAMLYMLHFDEVTEETGGLHWMDKAFMTAGVFAFTVLLILGVLYLPSVTASLSWREFHLAQSFLGWAALTLGTLHCVFAGLVETGANRDGPPKVGTWLHCVFFDTKQIPLILPGVTFLLKLPLISPFVDSRLSSIRSGIVYR